MKREDILKKVIEKAVKNGWKPTGKKVIDIKIDFGWHCSEVDLKHKGNCVTERCISHTIFDHDFAKALWGDKIYRDIIICSNKKCKDREKYWWLIKDLGKNWKNTILYCQACGNKLHTEKQEWQKENWAYHLQQLAISEDRIKYLEQFVK